MNLLTRFGKITTFILDIDGVMTDGKLYLSPNGDLTRTFSVKDGYAMKTATNLGYRIWVCSGGYTEGAKDRFAKLGISEVEMRVTDKANCISTWIERYGLSREELVYLGDDVPDIEAMKLCGLSCCPSDAAQDVRDICHFVSAVRGGEGFVREIIENVLKVRGDWPV
ncbi:MAG: HAD hydrolase family protein [Saprospiraceae bacterium]|nr:HAD hydrolase family protein [Saprospiraceae bacterium]